MLLLSSAPADETSIDDLLSAARSVVADDVTEAELKSAIDAGVWNEQRTALAFAIPRPSRTLLIALVAQPSGTFIAADVSAIEDALFRKIGLANRTDYERYETSPDHWEHASDSRQLLLVRLEAWTKAGRYSVDGPVIVEKDGSVIRQ